MTYFEIVISVAVILLAVGVIYTAKAIEVIVDILKDMDEESK